MCDICDMYFVQWISHYQEPKVVVLLISMAGIIFACLFTIHIDWLARTKKRDRHCNTVIDRPNKCIRTLYVVVGSVVANFTALFGKAFFWTVDVYDFWPRSVK